MQEKAGIIPYYFNEQNELVMMFMVPSDPKFGGPHPQIAKGCIDDGETHRTTALREGREELGLRPSNIASFKEIWYGKTQGSESEYLLRVYAVKVKNHIKFTKPGYETGQIMWLTNSEFQTTGRPEQSIIVEQVSSYISKNLI